MQPQTEPHATPCNPMQPHATPQDDPDLQHHLPGGHGAAHPHLLGPRPDARPRGGRDLGADPGAHGEPGGDRAGDGERLRGWAGRGPRCAALFWAALRCSGLRYAALCCAVRGAVGSGGGVLCSRELQKRGAVAFRGRGLESVTGWVWKLAAAAKTAEARGCCGPHHWPTTTDRPQPNHNRPTSTRPGRHQAQRLRLWRRPVRRGGPSRQGGEGVLLQLLLPGHQHRLPDRVHSDRLGAGAVRARCEGGHRARGLGVAAGSLEGSAARSRQNRHPLLSPPIQTNWSKPPPFPPKLTPHTHMRTPPGLHLLDARVLPPSDGHGQRRAAVFGGLWALQVCGGSSAGFGLGWVVVWGGWAWFEWGCGHEVAVRALQRLTSGEEPFSTSPRWSDLIWSDLHSLDPDTEPPLNRPFPLPANPKP